MATRAPRARASAVTSGTRAARWPWRILLRIVRSIPLRFASSVIDMPHASASLKRWSTGSVCTSFGYTCARRTVNLCAHAAQGIPCTFAGVGAQKLSDPPPPIVATGWWKRLARPLVRDYDPGLVALSKELAKKVGRKRPWSHSALSRFVATGQCSLDLATAISGFFKLPRPAFEARSVNEAWEMEAVSSKWDSIKPSQIEAEIIELEERLAERRRQAEEEALRQARAHQPGKRQKRSG